MVFIVLLLVRIYVSCMKWFLCFLFKQKTAYEMLISDWSSDVCSSDLFWRQSWKRIYGTVRLRIYGKAIRSVSIRIAITVHRRVIRRGHVRPDRKSVV